MVTQPQTRMHQLVQHKSGQPVHTWHFVPRDQSKVKAKKASSRALSNSTLITHNRPQKIPAIDFHYSSVKVEDY